MNHLSTLFLSIVTLLFVSCTEVVFETPQPPNAKNLTKIPMELQGDYNFVVLNEKEAIHIDGNSFDGNEGKKVLSDSLLLRKLGNKFVINQQITKSGPDEGKWSVFVLEPKGCGFLKATAFIISEDEYVPTFEETYSGKILGEGKEKQMLVDVDKKEAFETMLANKEATIAIILEKSTN